MRELRRSHDRKLFGVAAGCAEHFEMDKTLWRVGWVIGSICLPPLVLAYLILALVLPSARYDYGPGQQPNPTQQAYGGQPHTAAEPEQAPQGYAAPQPQTGASRRMTKSRDRWLSGVAGGVAEYLDLDPVLVRLLFLASLFVGGAGLLIYIILAVIMPNPDYTYRAYQTR